MTPELLNKLKHLAHTAAHLPADVTLEDEDAAMKALHVELAADTALELIALAESALLATAPIPAVAVEPAQLAVATHAGAHSTTVIINLIRGDTHTCIYSADHSANGETIGVSDLPDSLFSASKAISEPCGGCGETDPAKRCIGCGHKFSATPSTPAVSQSQAAGDALDAARYRWLKSKGGIDERDGGYHKSYWLPRITKEGGTIDKPIYHADLDAAIDAAMREQQT